MNDINDLRQLQSKIEIKSVQLPNGLKIYYSDVKNKKINFTIGGFVFKTTDFTS